MTKNEAQTERPHWLVSEDEQCPMCSSRCIHDYCECCEETCPECFNRWNLEQEAEREAAYQRDFIGPMFGFKVGEGDQ